MNADSLDGGGSGYSSATLVIPSGRTVKPIKTHAGGIAWYKHYLFVAETHVGVRVFDTNYMVNGSAFMLGCAYALLKGAHVRTDIFWDGFPIKKKGMIDLTSYLLLFFPSMIVLLIISFDDAWYAFQLGERSEQTAWRPLLWPFRAAVPLTALLFMIQGVSETLKCWFQIRTGREFEHRAKVEV